MQNLTTPNHWFTRLYRHLPVRVIATTGILISLFAGIIMWQWEQQVLRQRLQDRSDRLQDALQKELLLRQVEQADTREAVATNDMTLVRDLLQSAITGLSLEDLEAYFWQGELRRNPTPLALYRVDQNMFVPDLEANQPSLIGRGWLCPEFDPPTRSATGQAYRRLREANRRAGQPCRRELELGSDTISFLLLPTAEYLAPHRYWRTWSTLITGGVLASLLAIYLQLSQRYMENVEVLIAERTEKANMLQRTLNELQGTQTMLVHSERMSALGQMLAGIVHEINNPVQFISGNLAYLNDYTNDILKLLNLYQQHYPLETTPAIAEASEDLEIEFLVDDLPKLVQSMQVGVERINQIVHSMRNFSRTDGSQKKAVSLHEGINSTLLILHNRFKGKDKRPEIIIEKDYGELPAVECYGGQINQVFMNILANAIDALNERDMERSPDEIKAHPSQIKISTSYADKRVGIQIADNGPGIVPEIRDKIFEPFFTTKPEGQGTGLGMSISYKIIVEKHGGSLSCQSQPGHGTEFQVELPIQ